MYNIVNWNQIPPLRFLRPSFPHKWNDETFFSPDTHPPIAVEVTPIYSPPTFPLFIHTCTDIKWSDSACKWTAKFQPRKSFACWNSALPTIKGSPSVDDSKIRFQDELLASRIAPRPGRFRGKILPNRMKRYWKKGVELHRTYPLTPLVLFPPSIALCDRKFVVFCCRESSF